MWEKAVAATLVLTGAQGFGFALCQEMQCRLYHDKEQKQMLLYITGEITFLHRPMQEIFFCISNRLQEPYRTFTRTVAERMEEERGKGLHSIWEEEVNHMQHTRSYPEKAMLHLHKIGACFGCEEDELQIATITLMQKELEEEIESIKQGKEEKSRLIQTLSLLAGVFCIVLFL